MPTTPTDTLARLRAANPDPVSPARSQEPAAQATLEWILKDARADAGSGSERRADPRRRRWWGAAPVLAATLITVVVAGVALGLLGHRGPAGASGSRPSGAGIGTLIAHTPQRQLRRELGYISAASQSVENSRACHVQQLGGPTYIQGSPGSDLLSILGVLRRPGTPADRLDPQGLGPAADIYRGHIRRAFSAGGDSYYIVPARFDRAAVIPSDRCFQLQASALKHNLSKIPASLRKPTLELQAAMIAWDRGQATHAPRDTICLVAVAGNSNSSECGIPPQQIRTGVVPMDNQGTYSGVVPDGVASVTLIPPAAPGHPARTVTASVIANVYAVHVGQGATRLAPMPPTVIWHARDGRVIKRMAPSPDTAAARARACRKAPVACLVLQSGYSESSGASGSVGTPLPVRTR